MPQNIEDQIKAYLLEKLAELRAFHGGHVSVTARADHYSGSLDGREEVTFTAYSGILESSVENNTLHGAIACLLAKAEGKTEADIIREQAAELRAKADALEAKIQRANPGSKAALEAFHNSTKEAA